jgi:phytoene dehydrogenase-like protein
VSVRRGDAEVIVVGAGHNGLICAAYLARAGIDTLLVEARADVGGCASTVTDLDARFNICNCDHSMVRGMPIIDELDLASYGLRYLEPDVTGVNRFHDGSQPWLFLHDVDAHLDALAQTHPRSVDGYRRYLDDALPVAEMMLEIARTKPTVSAMAATVARRRAAGAARLLRWSRMSQLDVLRSYFDDWHLIVPAVTSGPTVWGAPPTAPGTGTAGALYATRHLIKSGRPVGGSGALTDTIRASFEAAGGRTRCNSTVDRLVVDDGSIRGVRLTDGTELASDIVVAACDPQRVFVDWLDAVPSAAQRLVERWRDRPVEDGYESKLDVVLGSLPTWRGQAELSAIAGGADLLAPTTLVNPDLGQIAEANALRASGHVHPHPSLMVNVPTVLDPDMQPDENQHVLSLEVLFTPYDLAGGWPDSSEPQRWLDVLEGCMEPGTLKIERWRAMTPDRYEAEFQMHRGHTPSYSGPPLAAFVGRSRETTRYRTPIDGLYLSGAGTFPGAGVFGAAGRNAADAVEHDVRGKQPVVDRARRTVMSLKN